MNFFVFVRLDAVDEFISWTRDTSVEASESLKLKVRICFPRFSGFTMIGISEDLWFTIRDNFTEASKCS